MFLVNISMMNIKSAQVDVKMLYTKSLTYLLPFFSIRAKFGNHNRIESLLHRLHDTELLRHHFSSYFQFETSAKPKPF